MKPTLALFAVLLLGACFTKPGRVVGDAQVDDGPGDAGDASPSALTARLIRNASWSLGAGTPGMSETGYSIASDGVREGDLVLFIGSVDNGADTFWGDTPGFTQLAQRYFGNDGQTFVLRYRLVGSLDIEPQAYAGDYGPQSSSHAAVISLIAISGANTLFPPDGFSVDYPVAGSADVNPVVAPVPGVTTLVPESLLIYAGGADWHFEGSSNTAEPPAGFTLLTAIGDKGTAGDWDWTSQQVAVKEHVPAGDSGAVTGSLTSISSPPAMGLGWGALVTIAPAGQ